MVHSEWRVYFQVDHEKNPESASGGLSLGVGPAGNTRTLERLRARALHVHRNYKPAPTPPIVQANASGSSPAPAAAASKREKSPGKKDAKQPSGLTTTTSPSTYGSSKKKQQNERDDVSTPQSAPHDGISPAFPGSQALLAASVARFQQILHKGLGTNCVCVCVFFF